MAQSFFEAKIAVLFMMIMNTNSKMETDSDSHLLNSVLIAHFFYSNLHSLCASVLHLKDARYRESIPDSEVIRKQSFSLAENSL